MKKTLSILILAVVMLFAVSAIAHDKNKVVVIPLTGKKTVNVANFTGTWQSSTTYLAGQTVQIDGSTYVATVTHTSDPTAPDMANWSLMAAKGADDFYLKYGFSRRPSERFGAGMCLFIDFFQPIYPHMCIYLCC